MKNNKLNKFTIDLSVIPIVKDPSHHVEIHHLDRNDNIIFKEILYGK